MSEEATLLHQTKIVLRAVLVSSHDALTIEKLDRDFKKQEGRHIPFASLGYRDLKSFLLSIPDAVTWDPHSKTVTAFVAPDANNAHVHKLVTEQKKKIGNSRRSNNCKPTSVSNHSYRQPQRQLQQQQHQIWLNQSNPYNQQSMFQQSMNYSRRFEPGNLLAPPNTLLPSLLSYNQNSLLGLPTIQPVLSNVSFSGGNHKNNNTTNRTTTRRTNDGSYQRGKRTDSKSENEMVKTMPEPKSNHVESSSTNLNGYADTMNGIQSDSNSEEIGALPPINDDDPVRFLGTVTMNSKYGRKISTATLPTTLNAGVIEQICVTEVKAFPHFYFQLYHDDDVLRGIQEDLKLHFENSYGRDRIRPTQIQIGNACAAFTANQWLRAEILSKLDDGDRLKLLFVDYGTVEDVPIEFVSHLPIELCQYPRLCHRGTLAFIEQLLDDRRAMGETLKLFCDLVSDRSVMAVCSNVDKNKNVLLTLVNTSDPDVDVIINKVLMDHLST